MKAAHELVLLQEQLRQIADTATATEMKLRRGCGLNDVKPNMVRIRKLISDTVVENLADAKDDNHYWVTVINLHIEGRSMGEWYKLYAPSAFVGGLRDGLK